MKTFVIPSIKRAVAPTANENLSSGYPIGQHWFDTATGKEYYHSSDGVWEHFATTHKALPDKNSEAAFQHVDTTTTKTTLDEADMVAIKDSVTGGMVLTPKSNLLTEVTAELALKELKANKQNSLTLDGTGTKFPTVDAVNTGLNGKVNTTDIEQVRSQDTNKVASSKLLDDELTALGNAVDEVTVDTLSNTADIRSLENVINSANINQEATATVAGVDTVALPKTAANTGMKVQLFGQSAQNLVSNGSLSGGTNGWVIYGTATNQLSISGDYITTSLTSTSHSIGQTIIAPANNKYYLCCIAKVDTTPVADINFVIAKLGVAATDGTAKTINTTDTIVSDIITIDSERNFIGIGRTVNFPTVLYIKKNSFIIINLTATFGAGNEPTKEQCDLLFPNYFEGSDNVLGTGRISSPSGKNLFNKLKINPNRVINSSGGLSPSSTANASYFIPVKASAQYALSVGVNTYIAYYNRLKQFISAPAVSGNVTITTPANTAFVRFSIGYSNMNTCQFEAGSSATAYEPYKQSSLYLTAPELRSNGLIKDEVRKGTNGYELIQRINPADGTVRATPIITPIAHAGLLNSNSNGTVYFEPIIADAGVYDTNMPIILTDYPIASFESIRKYANGTYTELNTATAVIASGGLSFTHPDLVSGDLVMFTYAYSKESIGRSMTLTYYDNRYVKVDTANGKTYRIDFVVTNGVVVPTATEV